MDNEFEHFYLTLFYQHLVLYCDKALLQEPWMQEAAEYNCLHNNDASLEVRTVVKQDAQRIDH